VVRCRPIAQRPSLTTVLPRVLLRLRRFLRRGALLQGASEPTAVGASALAMGAGHAAVASR
jgi:hypothetical protein